MTDTLTEQKIEDVAKRLCYEDCSEGKHLDYEAGCCSICKSPSACQGWRSYKQAALAAQKDAE